MEDFESRYAEVMVHPDTLAGARALKPIHERQVFGPQHLPVRPRRSRASSPRSAKCARPSIADLFVAVMGDQPAATQGFTQ